MGRLRESEKKREMRFIRRDLLRWPSGYGLGRREKSLTSIVNYDLGSRDCAAVTLSAGRVPVSVCGDMENQRERDLRP